MNFFPQRIKQAMSLLSDMILNSVYDSSQVQAQKINIYEDSTKMQNPQRLIFQNIHYTSYRVNIDNKDHYISQPSLGIRQNITNINQQIINEYRQKNFCGDNISISVAGNVKKDNILELANQYFGNVKKDYKQLRENSQKPYFTPSLIFMRDDQILNTSAGVSFQAPNYTNPDYFAMFMFKKIMGKYRVDKHVLAHLNSPQLQYNSFHAFLGKFPDMILHQPYYFPYQDTALFGNYFYGNQIFNFTMLYASQAHISSFASYINESEVFRARASIFNDLLQRNNTMKVSLQNALHSSYLNRLISRTQFAHRITQMDPEYLTRVATRWFWDKQISVAIWGNLHNVIDSSQYNRTYRRSTLGEYANIYKNYNV